MLHLLSSSSRPELTSVSESRQVDFAGRVGGSSCGESRSRGFGRREVGRALQLRAWLAICGTTICAACSDPLTYSPCVYGVSDPIFEITAVRDSASGAALPDVRISNIEVGASAFAEQHMSYLVSGVVRGVRVEGDELLCTPTCTFGFEEGEWRMTFSRDGYRSTTLVLTAAYSQRLGHGCNVLLSGPVKLDVVLAAESQYTLSERWDGTVLVRVGRNGGRSERVRQFHLRHTHIRRHH